MRNGVGAIAPLVVLLLAAPAAAQQRQFGIKAGPVISAIDVEPEDADYGTRVSGTFGGFFVLPVSETFALQLEALYSAKGGKGTSDLVQETLKIKLDYVEFPILARITASRSASRSIFLFGGVAPAIRTSAKSEFSTTVNGTSYGESIDVGQDYDHFDIALVVGGGVDIGPYIVIDGRYSWGLMNVYKNPEVESEVRNRALAFTVGWRF
jgi:hypothetical protein